MTQIKLKKKTSTLKEKLEGKQVFTTPIERNWKMKYYNLKCSSNKSMSNNPKNVCQHFLHAKKKRKTS